MHSGEWMLPIIYLISVIKKIRQVNNQIITSNSRGKSKATRLVKLLPCILKWLERVVLGELQVPSALQYRFKIFSGTTQVNTDLNDVCFFLLISRPFKIKNHSFKMWLKDISLSRYLLFSQKPQRSREKWDTVLKILLISI